MTAWTFICKTCFAPMTPKEYVLRNLPCDIVDDESLWAVSGGFESGRERSGGVLEWCYDEDDAKTRLSMMQLDPRYVYLTAHKWETAPEPPGSGVDSSYAWDEMWDVA